MDLPAERGFGPLLKHSLMFYDVYYVKFKKDEKLIAQSGEIKVFHD
jgi:hypothetical protein